MTYAPTIAYDVRVRPSGDSVSAWVVKRFEVGVPIELLELERGIAYDGQIRSVAANGRSSAWVAMPGFTLPATNRTGAAALPVSAIANQASMWDIGTDVTYEAASTVGGEGEATISVSAGTLVIGGATVSYGASSATVTGDAEEVRTVYLYYNDPFLQGGTRALGVTDNIVNSANAAGRVAITSITLTFPVAGGTGSGGGGIGGGGGGGGAHNPPLNENPV